MNENINMPSIIIAGPMSALSIVHIHRAVTQLTRGRRGRDRMVAGFTTALSLLTQSVHITTNVVSEFPPRRGVLDITLCDKSLSVTCDRSVVFSGSSAFLHQ